MMKYKGKNRILTLLMTISLLLAMVIITPIVSASTEQAVCSDVSPNYISASSASTGIVKMLVQTDSTDDVYLDRVYVNFSGSGFATSDLQSPTLNETSGVSIWRDNNNPNGDGTFSTSNDTVIPAQTCQWSGNQIQITMGSGPDNRLSTHNIDYTFFAVIKTSATISDDDYITAELYYVEINNTGASLSGTYNATVIADTQDPSVASDAVTAPNGGENWSGTQTITWNNSDITDSHLATNPITLYYSNDSGTTWAQIATGEANDGTYSTWDTSLLDDGANYLINITAVDNASNSAYDTSNATFTVDNTAPTCSIAYNMSSSTYFAAGTVVKIFANFTEDLSGMDDSTVTIYIETDGGDGSIAETTMENTSFTNYYYNFTIPAGSDDDGAFTVMVNGSDNATNSVAETDNSKYIDNTGAAAVISAPINASWYKTLGTISGTCSDAGSGVGSVNITIYNQTSDKYWNFSGTAGWDTGVNWTSTTLAGGGTTWSYNSGSVTWFNGTTYTINATATDDVSNVGTKVWNTFSYDDNDVTSSVTTIDPYWNTASPLSIAFTASDSGSGLDSVALYYRYSSDNSTWGTWVTYGSADDTPWDPTDWSFDFTTNGSGYYEFYTRATDNVSNVESAPAGNDTICGYDPDAPTGTIVLPVDNAYYNSGDLITTKINGTVNDPRNVTNAYIGIYNSTGTTYFNGSAWIDTYINLSANLSGTAPALEWVYDNTSAFPTWIHNQTYYVNLSSVDTAGNWNNDTASASFLYDTQNPTTTVTVPTDGQWLSTLTNITGTADDDGESGVATVNLTIYNQTGVKYWTGSAWSDSLTNLSVTGNTGWYYNTVPSSWTNGSTYLINASSTDNAGNVGSWDSNTLYIDTDDLVSSVTAISTYWQTSSLDINFTASDAGSGLDSVALYYKYSPDNSTWGSYVTFGSADDTPWAPTAWSFTFSNGSGYYQFYTLATDNASNTEATPAENDTWCAYDANAPSSSVTAISTYWQTSSPLTIAATASDTGVSGVANVTLYYRFSADNSTWGTNVSFGAADTSSPYSWSFTFSNGTGYYEFYSIAADNASNTESVPGSADTTCGYDANAPSSSVTAIATYWQTSQPLTIAATASDTGVSGVGSVSLYYRYSADNSTWGTNVSFGSDATSPYQYSFTFSNGSGYYQFYSIATDNATNAESAPSENDTWCAYDAVAPTTSVDAISTYWRTAATTISATASDTGVSGVASVTLYYRFSSDNSTWGTWMTNVTDTTAPYSWSFTFSNGSGYYQFYTRGTDNATNVEDAPGSADAICGYDAVAPTSSVDTITPYWKAAAATITATASDATSGVASVTLYYRFSSDNSTWGTWMTNTTDSSSPYSWSFTFSNGSGYYEFYSRATDNATNTEAAPANNDTICGYDTNAPAVSSVLINDTTVPSETYVKDTDAVSVSATVTDLQLASGDTGYLFADLSEFGGSATATATSYDGTTAWWNLSSVTCTPSDGTINVTINATDLAGNYNNTESDSITADNTAPSISYAVMDADNDGTNYSYVDVYFSETLDTTTVAYTDFNISISGIDTAAVPTKSGNMVTVRFDTTFQTGDSPTVGIDGSISDVVGNTITSGTITIETFNISFSSGLNLISFPCDVSTESLTTVLTDLTGTWTIYRYNATSNLWEYYNPSTGHYPSGNYWNLSGGEGYWLSIGTAQNLVGNYDLWPDPGYAMPSLTLKGQSWNLIGQWQSYNQSASTAAGSALASLSDSDIGSVWRYNSGGGYTNILTSAQNMEPGKGYWLWKESSGDKAYTPS